MTGPDAARLEEGGLLIDEEKLHMGLEEAGDHAKRLAGSGCLCRIRPVAPDDVRRTGREHRMHQGQG